jgi:hypothetical protein
MGQRFYAKDLRYIYDIIKEQEHDVALFVISGRVEMYQTNTESCSTACERHHNNFMGVYNNTSRLKDIVDDANYILVEYLC